MNNFNNSCHEKCKENDFKLVFCIIFMGIEALIDFKEVIKKTSPYLPIFIYGYALYFNISSLMIILFGLSLFCAAYYFIWEGDETKKQVSSLIFNKRINKKALEKLKTTNKYSFYKKGLFALVIFILKIGALITAGYYSIHVKSLIWGVFFIMSVIPIIFVFIQIKTLLKSSIRLKNLIKQNPPQVTSSKRLAQN